MSVDTNVSENFLLSDWFGDWLGDCVVSVDWSMVDESLDESVERVFFLDFLFAGLIDSSSITSKNISGSTGVDFMTSSSSSMDSDNAFNDILFSSFIFNISPFEIL